MYYNSCFCPNGYYYPYLNAVVMVESDADVWCGQDNRSSENFTVPAAGSYKISVPAGVKRFTIWEENVTLLIDKPRHEYPEQGSVVNLQGNTQYYIGNPDADGDFTVTLTQQAGAM